MLTGQKNCVCVQGRWWPACLIMTPRSEGHGVPLLLTHTCTPAGIPTIPRVPQWNSTELEEDGSIPDGGRQRAANKERQGGRGRAQQGWGGGQGVENNSSQATGCWAPYQRSGRLGGVHTSKDGSSFSPQLFPRCFGKCVVTSLRCASCATQPDLGENVLAAQRLTKPCEPTMLRNSQQSCLCRPPLIICVRLLVWPVFSRPNLQTWNKQGCMLLPRCNRVVKSSSGSQSSSESILRENLQASCSVNMVDITGAVLVRQSWPPENNTMCVYFRFQQMLEDKIQHSFILFVPNAVGSQVTNPLQGMHPIHSHKSDLFPPPCATWVDIHCLQSPSASLLWFFCTC